MQPEDQAKPTHFYQSLPYFGHKVFKCAGLVHEDASRCDFYRGYLATHSAFGFQEGPFCVMELPYTTDRINKDGSPYAGE